MDSSKSVFFANAPYETTHDTVSKLFAHCGTVTKLELFSRYGRSIGAGTVDFSSYAGANKAVQMLNGCDVEGRPLTVRLDQGKADAGYGSFPQWGGKGAWGGFGMKGMGKGMGKGNGAMVPYGGGKGMSWKGFGGFGGFGGSGWGGKGFPNFANSKGKGGKGSGRGEPECRVFFNNVPWMTTEGYLRAKFEQVGSVASFEFWRKSDGRSLGMGVCEFSTAADATKAIEQMNGQDVDGRPLGVAPDTRPAQNTNPEARVFFNNVSWQTSEGFLRSKFEVVGAIKAFEFWWKSDGRSLGMGVCEYESTEDAARAITEMNGKEIDGRTMYVAKDDRPETKQANAQGVWVQKDA